MLTKFETKVRVAVSVQFENCGESVCMLMTVKGVSTVEIVTDSYSVFS